jgi:opine dehydrogenase
MHETNFAAVVRQKGVHCIDGTSNDRRFFAPLDMVTRDEQEALAGAEVVFVLTQSLQHEELAKRIGPLLGNCRMVLVVPGYMGSLYFRRHCPTGSVLFAEGESTAIDARIVEPGTVRILFKNVRNALAMSPLSREAEGMAVARTLFGTYRYTRKNIIESALHNPNLIVHTTGTIMSASRIEYSAGEFWMYKEGFTPSVWSLIDCLDKEKNNVLQAFGCEPLKYVDACKFRNEEDLTADSLAVFRGYANSGPKGPASLETRYIDEDVPMGLCLLSSLGTISRIPTPLCDSLINIAGALRGRNFSQNGRTLTTLGLGHLKPDEIIRVISGG